MTWEIDFNRWKMVKKNKGRCLCSLMRNCPCDRMLEDKYCECKVFTEK